MLANSTRLGVHHFAYLRAVAKGISLVDAARLYLGIEHGAQAITVHRTTVDQVRAIARRRGDPRWRLVGIEIQDRAVSASVPTLDEWAAAEGISDWSEAELQAIYAERFGLDDLDTRRRQARNTRLRAQRLQLLRTLEPIAATRPKADDLLDGWLPPALAAAMAQCGIVTLGQLQQRIAQGGRWWSGLAAFGPIKAARLARYVQILAGAGCAAWSVTTASAEMSALSGQRGSNRVQSGRTAIDADDDQSAVRAWISSRAGSPYTAKQYEREAERFILFCVLVRKKAMSDAVAEDCRAYMDFLADIPANWISRRKVARMTPGWAPFMGPLSVDSQKLAITSLHSLFAWLVEARYLDSNPWMLVNRKLGDDAGAFNDSGSRAFTPQAWSALLAHLDASPASALTSRLCWLLCFTECTGLRAAELLRARREHLIPSAAGWLLRVHGKGRRNRTVPVPARAIAETRRYFENRGMDFDAAPAAALLLAALDDVMEPVSYTALHKSFTRFVRRALASAPADISGPTLQASAYWLRHTHATRAAERNVPPDVLQENLGQSDPRTTARYYRAQLQRRQAEIEKAFGE